MQTVEWYRERVQNPSLSHDEQQIIVQDWQTITGTAFSKSFNKNCSNCFRDAIILILRKMASKETGGYVLKKGVAFKYKGKVVTALNITSDAAEWYISQDLNHRDDFIKLARDYDDYTELNK